MGMQKEYEKQNNISKYNSLDKGNSSFNSLSMPLISQNIPNQQLYDMINNMYQNIPKKEEKREEKLQNQTETKVNYNNSNITNEELTNFLNEININQSQEDDDRVKNELISRVKILTGELEQYKKVNI